MGLVMSKLEAMFAKPFYTVAFGCAELCIRRRGVYKQYSRREVEFIRGMAASFVAANRLFDLEKGFESVKHRACYHKTAKSANTIRRRGACP